jgi:hypothetical protein
MIDIDLPDIDYDEIKEEIENNLHYAERFFTKRCILNKDEE